MSWPRAVAATSPAAAGTTARQASAAGGAQSTGTRGSTARTGKIGAVTDTRPRDPGSRPPPRIGRAGSSSPPARPPRTTCTAGKASEPNKGHRTHLPSRSCAAPWPTLTPTVAARPSSSSMRAAGTRRRYGPRDGNVLTRPARAGTTAPGEEQATVPAKDRPAGHRMRPCGDLSHRGERGAGVAASGVGLQSMSRVGRRSPSLVLPAAGMPNPRIADELVVSLERSKSTSATCWASSARPTAPRPSPGPASSA